MRGREGRLLLSDEKSVIRLPFTVLTSDGPRKFSRPVNGLRSTVDGYSSMRRAPGSKFA